MRTTVDDPLSLNLALRVAAVRTGVKISRILSLFLFFFLQDELNSD